MPSRNVVKMYDIDSYYHVYNRGVDKRDIFIDDQDYAVFLELFKRYLGEKPGVDSRGREFVSLSSGVEVVVFCLMSNHFHLLLFQIESDTVTKILRAVCSSYVPYFNKKYKCTGALFQNCFKAVKIDNHDYLQYLTRYIHRNPHNYKDWEWSSLDYWIGNRSTDWVHPQRLNDMSADNYLSYLQDDIDYDNSLGEISNILI